MSLNYDKQWNMVTVFEQLMLHKQMIRQVDHILFARSSFESRLTTPFWENSCLLIWLDLRELKTSSLITEKEDLKELKSIKAY